MSTKVCVIAGVGPGNGAAFARRFARNGYGVALLARKPDVTRALEKELPGSKAYVVDLTSQDAVRATFAGVRRDLGPVDVLIHNAAGYARSAFVDTKPEEFESVWRAGPWSLLLCGQEATTQMLEHGGGAIVAVGATASLRGGEIFTSFSAAKAAHRSLAQSMARGLGPRGIHVAYVVIDGAVDGLVRQFLPDKPDEFFVRPGAIADTVYHLVHQDRSAWTFELDLRTSTEKW
jgi:NAD(P)-dependent dehydrogenase (short-subunit alcohol dehydrogenase family)